MYFIDEIIDFINKNVDSWVLATLILLWIIIFPQYTGIHFNGDFKRAGSIESTLTRIIAILMLIGLFICLGRNYECSRKIAFRRRLFFSLGVCNINFFILVSTVFWVERE